MTSISPIYLTPNKSNKYVIIRLKNCDMILSHISNKNKIMNVGSK